DAPNRKIRVQILYRTGPALRWGGTIHIFIIPEIFQVTTAILNEVSFFSPENSSIWAGTGRFAQSVIPSSQRKRQREHVKKLTSLTPDCNFFVIWKGRNPCGPRV